MGFFSKTSVQVFARTFPLVQEETWTKRDAILHAVLSNTSIPDALTARSFGGMRHKMPALRKYAKEAYTLGLPNTASSNVSSVNDEDLAAIITQEKSLPGCVIAFSFLAPLTAASAILPFLISVRNYSMLKDTLGILPDDWEFPETFQTHPVTVSAGVEDTVMLDDRKTIQIIYRATAFYSYYQERSSDIGEDIWRHPDLPESEYTATYIEHYTFPAELLIDQEYYIVGYYALDSEGEPNETMDWWYYALNSGKYSKLDLSLKVIEESSAYPVVPFRYENENLSETNSPEIYRTGKKLLSKIDIDYDQLIHSLQYNPEGIENPGFADIDHAYLTFGIDLQTEDPVLLGYLVDFFTTLGSSGHATIWDQITSINTSGTILESCNYTFGDVEEEEGYTTDSHIFNVFDSIETTKLDIINPVQATSLVEHGLSMQFFYDRLISVVIEGSIGEVGHATKEFILKATTIEHDDQYRRIIEHSPDVLLLRKQISTNVYREVLITNLRHVNYGMYQDRKSVRTTLANLVNDEEEHNFIIPLHHPTMLNIPPSQWNTIYSQSVMLVLTGYEVTHLRWYQQDWFIFVATAIMMVITVYTIGTNAPIQTWITSLLLIAAVDGALGVLIFVLQTVLKALLVNLIAKGIVDVLGPEFAIIFAFLVFAYTGYMSTEGAVAIAPIVSKFSSEFLLKFSMQLASESSAAVEEETEEIQKEYIAELDDQEEQWEFLQERRDLLLPENLIPVNFLRSSASPANYDMSNADELYSRTHMGNIGALSLDVIENYVNVSLLLPKSTV